MSAGNQKEEERKERREKEEREGEERNGGLLPRVAAEKELKNTKGVLLFSR